MSEWKPVQPDDNIHLTVREFEQNYVSRLSFDALRQQLAATTSHYVRCTFCDWRFDYEWPDGYAEAQQKINAHALICEEDPRNAELEYLKEALQKIAAWAHAYPEDVFGNPDMNKARDLLERGGITLDSVAAYCIRNIVKNMGEIAEEALKGDK